MTDHYTNITLQEDELSDGLNRSDYRQKVFFIMHVATCIIITLGLPLTLMTICALYSLVRKDHVAPIFVINLLLSDLLQFCCMIIFETQKESDFIVSEIYYGGLWTSILFMLCVSLERYLVIAHPLWYRFKRTIKVSVMVCVVVWLIPPVILLPVTVSYHPPVFKTTFFIFVLIPFPLFIFSLVGTLRALSASVSVPSEEKRRVVGILVVVLLTYTLLFLPFLILCMKEDIKGDYKLYYLTKIFFKLSPLADLFLYVFIRKESIGQLFTAVTCCRVANTSAV